MRIVIDTNRASDLFWGNLEVTRFVEDVAEILVPVIVVGEPSAGFEHGSRAQQNYAVLRKFLRGVGTRTIYPDDETAAVYAKLYAPLRRKGTPIRDNDLWIAALAIQHGAAIYTRDAHFRRVETLAIV